MTIPTGSTWGDAMLRTVFRQPLWVAVLLGAAAAMPVAAQDSTPSSGVFKTGQQVHDLCTSKAASDLDTCDTFIMAAHDMIKLYGDTKMAEDNICLPTGTTGRCPRLLARQAGRAQIFGSQFDPQRAVPEISLLIFRSRDAARRFDFFIITPDLSTGSGQP